jgi:hypothetical protein
MIDRDFYSLNGPFIIKEVAEAINCIIVDKKYNDGIIINVNNNIKHANTNEIVFVLIPIATINTVYLSSLYT